MARFRYGKIGNRNLETVGGRSPFTSWMYEEIRPYIKGHVLEVGSGLGTYSQYLVKDDPRVVLSDVDQDYVKLLGRKFPKNDVFSFDISDSHQVAVVRRKHRFDTIVFLNVLEHVKDDVKALKLLRTLLRKNGRIICLVPTHKVLYNTIDASIGHYRRYTKTELRRKALAAGYEVEHVSAFNFFAMFGWFLSGNILRRKLIAGGSIRLFNALVPMFKFFERAVLRRSVGISIIIVAKR